MPRTDPQRPSFSAAPRSTPRTGAVAEPPSARTDELARALAVCDPMRMSFDIVVRRFVRAERADGRDLEAILATLATVLRRDVEPALTPERRDALQHAVAWFAVSEYHRAD